MYYNVNCHLCLGCTEDDVALVQYLPSPHSNQLSNGESPIVVANVNAVWVPKPTPS
jgi:hypothetical protein